MIDQLRPVDVPVPAPTDQTAAGLAAESAAWHQLSVGHAARDLTREAVLSMWASDLSVLHLLLWENGLSAAPAPDTVVRSCAEAVQAALKAHTRRIASEGGARDVVERARAAMAAAFDASVHDLLTRRLLPLDHLTGLGRMTGAGPAPMTHRAGREPEQLLDGLRAAACDGVTAARALANDVEEADRQLWQATLACYEAFLLDSALSIGDVRLTTVDLRWDRVVAELGRGPESGIGDAAWLRETLLADAAPAERPALAAELGRAGKWPW